MFETPPAEQPTAQYSHGVNAAVIDEAKLYAHACSVTTRAQICTRVQACEQTCFLDVCSGAPVDIV